MSDELNALDLLITEQGDKVRSLKAQKITKAELQPELGKLKQLKSERDIVAEKLTTKERKFDRNTLEALLSRRFFIAPSFQIYGGVSGLYDYGPPMCGLQNNFLSLWRQHFVLEEDMLELECTNLSPEEVLKTSGHVERFTDDMVKDLVTGDIFRADHLVKAVLNQRLEDDETLRKKPGAPDSKKKKKLEKLEDSVREEYLNILETLDNYQGPELAKLIRHLNIKAPETQNELSEPVRFNLMFDTQIGPTGQLKGYLRPETAQGHFVNFKKLLEFNTGQIPFASASIGKSFRNEISPKQGLLRVREFTMAEIEHYVDPENKKHPKFVEVENEILSFYSAENQLKAAGPVQMTIGEAVKKGIVNNQTLGYFVARIYLFLVKIGIDPKRLRFRQHMKNEMAHYACDCWDAEIESSYGWIESVGCADRSAFDLTCHSKKTGEKLVVREALTKPIIKDCLVLEFNKKVLGPAFRKNAKFVEEGLESMKLDEEEFKQDELEKLKKQFDSNGGIAKIIGSDGNEYEISDKMIQVVKKTIKKSIREYVPNVIEPSFGIGRILYALLEHRFNIREGDEARHVLSFPASIAPFKALIVPISHNDAFLPFIKQISVGLRKRGMSNKIDDSASSLGKRYARNDELGTPFAVTVDFETEKDGTVTLRERDSMKQIRQPINVICDLIKDLVDGETTWHEVTKKYPIFQSNNE
ncbi:Glycine--tRNA ligase 1, mitochondrial [Clydaea vesicula]|uniref:glycine--tRNA ligase n=1 Tax=Clydaea vesicula TaxID=447962 RepID=A0AAD5UBB4_9FUNG|nr:Glycine--tRNA ligase 1, mitochondrial [Clydaea vesicula]